MTDPLTIALSVYKVGTIAGKAKGLLERLGRGNTVRFIAERDEMHRQWDAETVLHLSEHVEDSREKFLVLGGTIEEHGRLLNQLLEQHEVQLLAALYADAAYREVVAERRRMLSFAAASILDLNLTIEEKASAERVLQALDPVDVLELHKLSRAVGRIERLAGGRGQEHGSTDALRYALLSSSRSDDALSSARCVRETILPTGGGWGGAAVGAQEVAYVTDRGALVLRVLEKYVDEKHDAFVGCGREEITGSRSEVEARKSVAGIAGLMPGIHAALRAVRTLESWSRPQFEQPRPTLVPGERRVLREVVSPLPDATSRLHLQGIPPAAARGVPVPAPGNEITVEFEDLPGYGRPATNVLVTGPYDLLRWVADDLDARWS